MINWKEVAKQIFEEWTRDEIGDGQEDADKYFEEVVKQHTEEEPQERK